MALQCIAFVRALSHNIGLGTFFFLLCGVPGSLFADDNGEGQRRAAAAAYDHGTEAFRAQDYVRAAELYSTAYRLAPAAPALIQAARSYLRAGDDLHASSAALALKERHGASNLDAPLQNLLSNAFSRYLHVEVVCESCELTADGQSALHSTLFLEAGVVHRISAQFATDTQVKTIVGAAGEHRMMTFVEPQQSSTPPSNAKSGAQNAAGFKQTLPAKDRDGFPPLVVYVGAGLTAVTTGVAIWSGLDTLANSREYKKNPTPERLEEGRSLETRTTVLIVGAAALGVATLAVALFFTDWDTDEKAASKSVVGGIAPLPEGGAVGLVQTRF